jgi:hypothetical protein
MSALATGTKTTGAGVARMRAGISSSAIPFATLPTTLTVAG